MATTPRLGEAVGVQMSKRRVMMETDANGKRQAKPTVEEADRLAGWQAGRQTDRQTETQTRQLKVRQARVSNNSHQDRHSSILQPTSMIMITLPFALLPIALLHEFEARGVPAQ